MAFNWIDKCVLIVEDNISNYKLLEAILLRENVKLKWIENGMEAVEDCKKNKYDLILMDIQLPELDGFEATKMIRKFDINTPIVVITAFAKLSEQINSFKIGCNDFITKPFRPAALLPILNKYLK